MRSTRLFFQMMAANLRGLMAFKADFLISFSAGLLSQTIGLLFLGVLFSNISTVAGWNVYEAAVLYGYMFVGEGVMTLFFQGTNGLWRQVRRGEIDRYMLRPLPLENQIYGRDINLAGAGTTATGLAVLGYSLSRLSIDWSWWRILVLAASLILGPVIRVNINFASSAAGMLLEGGGIKEVVEDLYEMGKYPLDIYPKVFRVLLLTLVPYAAVSFVPAAVLLGKRPVAYILLLPAATVLIVWLRKYIFRKAMEHYEGAGN